MKLGLQGTTFVYASGDDGVDSNACLGANNQIYDPDQDSSCPYILSVGGSGLPFDNQPGGVQVSSRTFVSGSGFSNVHLVPDYQKDVIAS
jgi:tripeptidyl-peptidase-1